ncbi:tetratricopeptide repeat protein [bacterium]|nr:tetratricopeptide repeat protein [bacterium]
MKNRFKLLGIVALCSAGAYAQVQRHIAWMEGSFQTGYQVDRDIAKERLRQWDGAVPDPKDTEKYLEYLSVVDAGGRGAEAEGKMKQFLADNPKEKRAAFILGVHYVRAKKLELAKFFFAQLEKDPGFEWKSLLYNNLGMIVLGEKNRDLAIEYFEKATKADPPSPAPFANLGALYLESRSYADAEKAFRKALDLDGEFEDAALGLGVALEGQGKFEDAHKAYANFIDDNARAISVLYNDSLLLGNRLGKREEATQLMTRYIQLGGKESAKAHESLRKWR